MENQPVKKRHSFTLDSRSKGTMNGVEEVLSYGDDELCLGTSEGRLTVIGKGLKIEKYNTEDGSLTFSGRVNSLRYDEKKPPLYKRLFK
ncbi:MAG: YabP/YqfC family sporulation protein [Christensenellales bacterium]|jgi:hypothetical protein